jgi:very-short-patch-repair endonuclease
MNILYEKQYSVDGRCFDFYIPSKNLLIEVDGIYWHGRNIGDDKLNVDQANSRRNDKYKNELAIRKGYNLLRVWEDELDTLKTKIETIC